MKAEFAEDIGHYWKTSKSSPDKWIDQAKSQIEQLGGEVLAEAFGSSGGKEAYMLAFEIEGSRFKVVWPVLPSKVGNHGAARRQAATMLFHDIKAKSISAAVKGADVSFLEYKLLPDGRVASEVAAPELANSFPLLPGRTSG